MKTAILMVLLLTVTTACGGLSYDLSGLDYPVIATPAPAGSTTEPFHLEEKLILWGHGLFGQTGPEVPALLDGLEPGPKGIANFRVKVSGGFHDWLLTHLSLTIARIKTVEVSGELVR